MALLRLYSFAPNQATLTILNGTTVTGYAVPTGGLDFGNAAWEHSFSGARGTQGARPSIGVPQNRVAAFPIRIVGQVSKDAMLSKVASAVEIVDDMRRYGGRILWQSNAQTYRQWFDVMTCGWSLTDWTQHTETNFVTENLLTAICAPYLAGDPMDTLDTFSIDSSTDYTAVSGNTGSISVSGGQLVPSSTGLKVYQHTAKGYSPTDVEVTLKILTAGTVTNGVWGVTARCDLTQLDTCAFAQIEAAGNLLRVGLYNAGSIFTNVSTAFTPAINSTYWIRLRLEGNMAYAEVFTTQPDPSSTPNTSTSQQIFGSAFGGKWVAGYTGFRITPASTSERYDDFTSRPYTYRLANTPEQIRLGGQIPGDVPAICDVTITPRGGAATPVWGLAGWAERPLVHNLCWNGDADDATIGASGWVATAVAGVIGAGTSATRITTAASVKYGAGALQIVTPATTDTGASFLIPHRFKQGRLYVAMCWANSAAGVTSSRIKLGVSGDITTGTAAALSTTLKVYSAMWTPAADRDAAYVAFGVNAATLTTLAIDGVIVAEVPAISLGAAQASTVSTAFTVYSTPTDVPNLLPDGTLNAPFLALIDQEIIRVTAIAANGAWTADRGVEGSTAATHLIDALVGILPPLRPQYEGKGAQAPFGVIECESYVPALTSVSGGSLAVNADANARGGQKLTWTPSASGAQTGTLVYFVDPNTLFQDDYTLGEVDVEVFLREAWATTLTGMRVTLSAQPESGSTGGPERFTREFGNVGKLIQTATAKVSRQHRLGTLPLVIDPANPQRWRLKLGLSVTGGATPTWDFDHLTIVATRSRTALPTGKANDIASAAASYPSFVPYDAAWGATSAMSKTLRADGSATISIPGGYSYPDSGPGRPIELPDHDLDMLVKLSTRVPDDPTSDATDEATANLTTTIHAAVTPRYVIGRAT